MCIFPDKVGTSTLPPRIACNRSKPQRSRNQVTDIYWNYRELMPAKKRKKRKKHTHSNDDMNRKVMTDSNAQVNNSSVL